MNLTDTIVATSSPAGRSVRAIVRLSGPDAATIVSRVFQCDPSIEQRPSYSSACGFVWLKQESIRCPAVAYVMLAPRSYTREDVVELHVPGAPPLLAALVDALVAGGARPAEPGEFTRRAFLNGRIDLTQAEAVQAVIQARSQAELRVSQGQLGGTLRRAVESLRADLVGLLAQVEASIDFADQDIQLVEPAEAAGRVDKLLDRVRALGVAEVAPAREGVVTVICGLPNAGKSSLLNALAGEERAIVTPVAGTTRDTVEHCIETDGVSFRLIDTAGLRAATRDIEAQAVERANRAARLADLALLVIDGSRALSARAEAMWDGLTAGPGHVPAIVVISKCDLPRRLSAAAEGRLAGRGAVISVSAAAEGRLAGRGPVISVSAVRGDGLDELRAAMVRAVRSDRLDRSTHSFWVGARHRGALRAAAEALGRARGALADGTGLEFAAADLHHALSALGEIVGVTTPDDILDAIFARFCVGK